MLWSSPVSSTRTAIASTRSPARLGIWKISESCLRNWLAQDAVEFGEKPGLTKAEREELVRLRRENRTLRAKRDLLSRAGAFFAQGSVLPPRQ